MNFQEYLAIKRSCGIKIRIFSISVYAITLFSLIQTYLLIFKIDKRFDLINMYILETTYSLGMTKMGEGNSVFGLIFYGIYALFVVLFIYSSISALFGSRRLPYGVTFLLYTIDALICLIFANYSQFLFHVALLIFVYLAFRNRSYLNLLKNNVWGTES